MIDTPRDRKRARRTSAVREGAYHVVARSDGWAVQLSGSDHVAGTYGTQADAVAAAREAVRSKGGEIRIQGPDGRWREIFVVGRDQMASISSIEGLYLSAEMKRDFRDFDRRGLSDDERRKILASKYGKARA